MAVRSTYNNRLAPLAGLASFTGLAEETKLGNALSVAVYISDLSTLTIEQSPNKTNWYIFQQKTIEPNVQYIIQEPCTLEYFRITIHNEMLTNQQYCNLVTSFVQELTQGVDIRPLSSATDSVTVSNLPASQLVAGQNSNFDFYPTVDNNTVAIYADGTQGTNVAGGWHYRNTPTGKINWYLYSAPNPTGNPTTAGQTVASVNSMYAVINQQSTLGLAQAQNPFVIIYTRPDSGVNASWYKSKLFYGSNAHTDISGVKLLYTGTDPSEVHPEITGINRIKLDFNLSLSTKTEAQASAESVWFGTLQTTNNTTISGEFNFTMSQFGVDWLKVKSPLPIENGKVQIEGTVAIENSFKLNTWVYPTIPSTPSTIWSSDSADLRTYSLADLYMLSAGTVTATTAMNFQAQYSPDNIHWFDSGNTLQLSPTQPQGIAVGILTASPYIRIQYVPDPLSLTDSATNVTLWIPTKAI